MIMVSVCLPSDALSQHLPSHLGFSYLEFTYLTWKKQESSRKTSTFCFIDYTKAFDCVDHNQLWKILREMGIPDHLTCLLRNLYAGQEATVRTGHGTTDWFQIGKGVPKGCILSPCLFNLYAKYIMEKAMAPHSSTLAWKIPWTEEPGRLQSMGSIRVRHD